MRLQLRCCISCSERKQRMMIKLWIDRKLEEIISPGTKSFPIFNDFERNYFFRLSIWALIFSPFQCLDLAKFVSLFGAHCFVGFPGYRVGLFTLGFTIPFHAKKTSRWFQLCSFCVSINPPFVQQRSIKAMPGDRLPFYQSPRPPFHQVMLARLSINSSSKFDHPSILADQIILLLSILLNT